MNRIDRIAYFEPLDEAALMVIFDKEFRPYQERFHDQGIRVEVPEAIKHRLVEQVARQKMGARPLQLEMLSGPLDGHTVTLENEAVWGLNAEGVLSFPWDVELGTPQARFFLDGRGWWLEAYPAEHGTYCATRVGRVADKLQLEAGYVLKAGETWLCVVGIVQNDVKT